MRRCDSHLNIMRRVDAAGQPPSRWAVAVPEYRTFDD